jgi:dolichol-phosphate mannosyltransferase
MDLTVVLPAIDEAESLRLLLPRLKVVLGGLGLTYELLVVDGGSRDGTATVASGLGARVLRQTAEGFAGAYLAALPTAKGDYVLTMDADGSHDAADVPNLWAKRREADVVIGSRFVPGGSAEMPALRYWASRLLNAVTRLGFGLPARDASSGFRLYHGSVLVGLPIETRDFSVQQEMLARVLARGGRCVEVPFHYRPRIGGRSKAGFIKFFGSYVRMLRLLRGLR